MEADYDVAARTIAGEADNQSEIGQRAIAHVLVNRRRSGRWGKSLMSVCQWPAQFSCWNRFDGNSRKANPDLLRIIQVSADDYRLKRFAEFVEDAEQGEPDPTKGALYYKVSGLPWPKDWGPEVSPTFSVGTHSFYILREGSDLHVA